MRFRRLKPVEPPRCTCHWLDLGPRCPACVAACSLLGHPETGALTNGTNCACGTPKHMREG